MKGLLQCASNVLLYDLSSKGRQVNSRSQEDENWFNEVVVDFKDISTREGLFVAFCSIWKLSLFST